MPKIDDYQVVTNSDERKFEDCVKAMLNNGYELHGPMQAVVMPDGNGTEKLVYVQAMIHQAKP